MKKTMSCLHLVFVPVLVLSLLGNSGTLGQEPDPAAKPATSGSGSTPAPSAAELPKGAAAGVMRMVLRKNLTFEGSPLGIDTIKMTTLFGEVSLPLHTILGIRFAQGPNEQTTVVGLNGDALTGNIQLSELKFISEWGEAKVNVSHLVSIVFRPDLAWTQVSTPNGPRWQLSKTSGGSSGGDFTPVPTQGGRRVYPPR